MIRKLLKTALPRTVLQLLRDLGRMESTARGTYFRRMLHKRTGYEVPLAASLPPDATLVAICHGNILRSAYAEALLKRPSVAAAHPGLRVSSAGLHAFTGKPADPRGVTVARERGVDLGPHRATMLSGEIVAGADLLLVMDAVNAAEVISRHPEAASKVVMLGVFDPQWQVDPTIPDPYMGKLDTVRESYRRVEAAVEGLVVLLSTKK